MVSRKVATMLVLAAAGHAGCALATGVQQNTEAIRGSSATIATNTQAVRDSTSDVGPIKEGDYLGIAREGIKAVESTAAEAATRLLDLLVTDDHEIVTVIEGEGATPADTRAITEWLGEHRPGVSPEVHHGGQPLYPYLLGVE